jgi:hypothetical protein
MDDISRRQRAVWSAFCEGQGALEGREVPYAMTYVVALLKSTFNWNLCAPIAKDKIVELVIQEVQSDLISMRARLRLEIWGRDARKLLFRSEVSKIVSDIAHTSLIGANFTGNQPLGRYSTHTSATISQRETQARESGARGVVLSLCLLSVPGDVPATPAVM